MATNDQESLLPSLAFSAGVREPSLDKNRLPIRRFITLALQQTDARPLARVLWWTNVGLTVMYAFLAIVLVFLALFLSKQTLDLYWSPLRWNSGASAWYTAQRKAGSLRPDFLLMALVALFAIARAAHLISWTRAYYMSMVMDWGYNTFRWAMHGMLLGGIIATGAMVMGTRDIFIFVSVWVTYALYTALRLSMEQMNPAENGTKNAKYPVNWMPFLLSVLGLLYVVAVHVVFFAIATDDKSAKVPWYAYAVLAVTVLVHLVDLAVNALYHATKFLRRFVVVEIVHLVAEAVLVVVIPLVIVVGFGIA